MTFQKALLATLIAGSLTACGGDSSSSGNTTADPSPSVGETLNGKAADGYLQDALVCLDLDQNKSCDDGEPSAVTDQSGGFSLVATQEQIDASPLLVEVIAGKTTDSDEPGVAIVKSYKLTAPAASEFVSPITTLIQNEIEKGGTPEEAVTTIQGLLGTDLDITQDYIAGQADDTKKDELKKLHRVAQVTARVIATKLDELKDEAANNGVSDADLINVINEEVSKVVSDIVADVENTPDGDFNADDAATSAKDKVDVSAGNIKDKIDANNADRNTEATSLVDLMKNEGLLWLGGDKEDGKVPVLEYGTLKADVEGAVTDEEYSSTADLTDFELNVSDSNLQYILTDKGWSAASDEIVGIHTDTDGHEVLVTATPELSIKVKTKKVDVSGLNVATIVAKTADSESGTWDSVLPSDLKFPANTVAYKLKMEDVTSSYFSFNAGDWCTEEEKQTRGDMCNSVYIEGASTRAQTLNQLISAEPGVSVNGMVSMVGVPGGAIMAELLEIGAVKYYLYNFGSGNLEHFANGAWKDQEVHGKVLRKISAPTGVAQHNELTWNNFNTDDNTAYFSVVNDFVRIVWQEEGTSFDEYVFGANALPIFIDNISYPLTLEACLVSLPDAGYVQKVGDITKYESNKKVFTEFGYETRDYVETFKYLGANFSWLSEYTNITDMPSWVEATDGKLMKTLFSSYNIDGQLLSMEASYHDANSYYGQEGLDAEGNYGYWGAARAILPNMVENSDKQLNTPNSYMFDNVSMNDIKAMAEAGGGSFDDLTFMPIDFTETYEGKFDVTVPAGTFQACKVTERVFYDNVVDVDTRWYTNRGSVKQEIKAPGWAPLYNRYATELPQLN
ncbi:hypothetical protein A1OO_06270 [Enterovibrio norvegicus FF-33]|uniref:hypothetical protein n=1 Tax=Enterovibrio norvegicus TaxID=188144 RepID=UPI0002D2E431|nr:hypothetical protein [Enterovibrio norvegicus]OEE70370.1 hypothetical protein A1OO_06270 [Enterovibrio norvegicus FF-33]